MMPIFVMCAAPSVRGCGCATTAARAGPRDTPQGLWVSRRAPDDWGARVGVPLPYGRRARSDEEVEMGGKRTDNSAAQEPESILDATEDALVGTHEDVPPGDPGSDADSNTDRGTARPVMKSP
jgi:hypothetical protein